jgi:hypothetical protein
VVFSSTLRYMLLINRFGGRANQSQWLLLTSEEDPPFVAPGNDRLTSLKGPNNPVSTSEPSSQGTGRPSLLKSTKSKDR